MIYFELVWNIMGNFLSFWAISELCDLMKWQIFKMDKWIWKDGIFWCFGCSTRGQAERRVGIREFFRLKGDLQANRFCVTKTEGLIQKNLFFANIVFMKYNWLVLASGGLQSENIWVSIFILCQQQQAGFQCSPHLCQYLNLNSLSFYWAGLAACSRQWSRLSIKWKLPFS